MKKILFALSAATVMVACNTNPNRVASEQTKVTTTTNTDTSGLAQFQAYKQQQAFLASQSAYAPASVAPVYTAPNRTTVPTRTVVKYVPVRSYASHSYHHAHRYYSSRHYSHPVAMSSESSNTAKVYRRRGWSKAAKGAVIGGVVGAGTGAIINKKNRGVGAVIGGVLGAGAGYGIGRGMDKRDGRY